MTSSQTGKASSVRRVRWSRFWLVLLSIACCSRPRASPAPPAASASASMADPVSVARERLARFEAEQRQRTDFLHLPPASVTHGPDPYALARLDAQHSVGV